MRVLETIADPRADLNLKVSNMGLEGGEAAGLTGIDIDTTGRWRNGRLALDGNATTRQRGGIDMRLQAEVPLVLRQEPLTVDLPQNAPISAALRGNVELATFNDMARQVQPEVGTREFSERQCLKAGSA